MKAPKWTIVVIFILAIIVVHLLSRSYESRYVGDLLERNTELEQLKLRTEQFVDQNVSGSGRQVFRQLGYNISMPLPDTAEAEK